MLKGKMELTIIKGGGDQKLGDEEEKNGISMRL